MKFQTNNQRELINCLLLSLLMVLKKPLNKRNQPQATKDVNAIGGASMIRQCLKAGVADELHIDVMPILLCSGLRLFEGLDLSPIQLDRLNVVNLPDGRTHFKFRVVK